MKNKILIVTIILSFILSGNVFLGPEKAQAATLQVGPGQTYTTIQACADVAAAGDTCLVNAGTYNERVTVKSSGTSNSNRVIFKANGAVKVRGFSASNKDYFTIDGFEITNIGMSQEFDRNINIVNGTGIQVLNNNIHDTAYQQCIVSSATFAVYRGNTISYCGEAMSILGAIAGSKTITAGVNDKIKFRVQGGTSQTVTLAAGTYFGSSQYAALYNPVNASITGAVLYAGATGRFELRSTTMGPTSTITLEPVGSSAYTTFGWSEGVGTIQGHHAAITILANDALFENNLISHVGDYVTTGNDITRVVIRNNTFGPADPYNADHIDGIQTNSPNGTQKLLFEGNVSISNNNADNHFGLFQRLTDSTLILRYNSTYLSNGTFDITRGTYYGGSGMASQGAFLYNNTFYDNGPLIGNGVQVYARTSSGNFGRNNIWYNAGIANPYSPGNSSSAINKDYDLWFAGTGNPLETNAVNADPLFTNGPAGSFTLQSSSPAINTGGALTNAINSGVQSQSLQVGAGTAGFFQDGWAGVTPDTIAVGTSGNYAQISSIDYSTNTITLATPLSWAVGDTVYLHTKSDGVQVLYGSAPDIGAFEYNSGSVTPPPNPPPTDTTAPIISSISSSALTTTSATISWTTNESADTQIDYGTNTSYGQQTSLNSSLLTSHSQSISGLSAGTLYHYRVRSRDSAGNLALSSDNIFITSTVAPPPVTPPTTPPPVVPPLTPPPVTPTPTTPPVPPTIPPTSNLKLINSNGTYYLIIDGIRHGITNPGLLTSYGFTFEMGKTATPADLALPEGELLLPSDGILAKTSDDPTVWLISENKRRGFTSEAVFTGLGFKFSQVLVITAPELNKLARGTNLDNPSAAHPEGVDINEDGIVYWIQGGQKHPYPSLTAYNSWRVPNDFSRVLPANQADRALPVGGMVSTRVLN